jgi:hypothetical protein
MATGVKSTASGLRFDETFQRREWRAQRAGWAVLALLVGAALAGLTGGSGPFARARLGGAQGSLEVEHERIARRLRDSEVTVRARAAAPGRLVLRVDRSLFDDFALERVVPTPAAVAAESEALRFEFALAAAGAIEIDFALRGRRAGAGRATVAAGDERVELRYLILP